MGYSLGIDLGTSLVAAAVADTEGPRMVPLAAGSTVAPAVVFVGEDGRLDTGASAAEAATRDPGRAAREIKRKLGDPTPVLLSGKWYDAGTLLSALLQDALARVTDRQGSTPAAVALTYPPTWDSFRRELFADVARSAGFAEPVYTTEAEAAVAAWAAGRPPQEGAVVAVYDLGAATFSATVLRRTPDGFRVIGTPEGIDGLGGTTFDDAVLGHVCALAGIGEPDLRDADTATAMAGLRQDCRRAREALSVDAETRVPVAVPGRQTEVTLTRAELEGMMRAPLQATVDTLGRVLRGAGVEPGSLSAVLLVGGCAHIPLVARMISAALGRAPEVDAHPEHTVALGAALLAQASRGTAHSAAPAPTAANWAPAAPAPAPLPEPAPAPSPAPVAAPGPEFAPEPSGGPAPGPGIPVPAPPRRAERVTIPARGARPRGVPAAGGAAVSHTPPPGFGSPPGAPPEAFGPTPGAPPGAFGPPPGAPPGAFGPPPGAPPPRAPEPAGAPPPVGWQPIGGPPGGGVVPPIARGTPPGAPPAIPPPPPDALRRNWRVPLIVGLAVLLVAAVGVVAYLQLRPSPKPTPAAARASHAATTPSAATPTVATAVPIPSLGPTIDVGKSPSFVVAAPNGRQLYVASPDAGAVTVVDTAVNKVTATIPISAGPPQFLAFSPDGRKVYVSVWNDARTVAAIAVLDTTTNSIVATIPVSSRPFLAAVSPDGKRIYVPDHDTGTVSVIDATTDKPAGEFHVPANPHSVVFTPDGSRIYIANHESNLVSVVDTATNAVIAQIPVPTSPHNVAVHPTRPLAIVASYDAGSVTAIDTSKNTAIATIPVGANPQHVAYSADGRFAYVTNNGANTVSVINLDTLTVTATIPTGAAPTSMAVLPNGKAGYVSNTNGSSLTVLNLAG